MSAHNPTVDQSYKLPSVLRGSSPESGLAQFFREAWKYPVLKPEEEYTLAVRYTEDGDIDAAHKLVTSHLRLVAKIAMGYRGYGLPVSDLISEGNIGLMKAVKKFDPYMGFRLSTYAMWWIKASITEYVLKSWSLVKMGTVAAQKKLFFSLRKHKARLGITGNGELLPEQATELARDLKISEHDIINMSRRLGTRDLSLNAPLSNSEDGVTEFQDTLIDEGASPEEFTAKSQEKSMHQKMISTALKTLDERELHIFTERRLKEDPVTLEELGASYGISRERVRQLEVRAFEKVQKAVIAAKETSDGTGWDKNA
ncbi:MAG: RNA polymerase sigma factor RpoH [Rhodospirillaceae bacterium]|nr:RNA polymerase sigma factor RpoH [Rhodospirillaceae bacterium]